MVGVDNLKSITVTKACRSTLSKPINAVRKREHDSGKGRIKDLVFYSNFFS